MERISEHISYEEATKSASAIRNGIDNTPNEEQLKNIRLLAENVFEKIRLYFDEPIYIASFFRCKALNDIIGGAAAKSQHMTGEAMDIDNDGHHPTNRQIFDYIKDNLDFDQLILEYPDDKGNPSWVHVSYKEKGNRKQILVCRNTYPKYVKYED